MPTPLPPTPPKPPTPTSATLLAPSPHGAGDHGLICGWHFSPGQPPQEIVSLAAGVPAPKDDGFVWLHLNLSHAGAEPWLRAQAPLSEAWFDALADGSRSTRLERDGDDLFAVINDVTFDFTFDASDVATLWVAVQPRLVVTARRHPLRSVDRLRMAAKRGEPMASSVDLLDHLLRDQADELQAIVRRAAERLDDIEDAVLSGHHHQHTAELGRLRRLMVRLQRLLAPEPSALLRMLSRPPAWVDDAGLAQLHRASEEFALVLRDVGSLQERIRLLLDEAGTRVAEENNRSLYTLTMVTVLALPINLLAGLMGMNVGGIPLAEHPHGFWWMLVLIGSLTLALAWGLVRRLRPPR